MSDFKIATARGKVPLDLIPLRALKGVARVFEHGGHKYAPGNFHEATIADGAVGRYAGALLRHLAAMQDPNGLWDTAFTKPDDDSGLPEIDHAIAGLIMLRSILIKDGLLDEDPGQSRTLLTSQPENEKAP